MDIWDWVEGTTRRLREGDGSAQRLAKLMRELPSATCDDEHERVDLLVPEAIALARRLEEPWVELFLRHWNLQSRVLHRNLARPEELREAVDLLEFAARAQTSKCPQSVCVTQDLACCYSRADGPGYVAERLAVADETLARIDPSWPCFDCISAEYFSALMDDLRAPEALAFLDRQQAKLAEHGIFQLGSNLVHNRADVLLELDRPEEALALLDGVRDPNRLGESYAMHHRMIRVKVLLALGRLAAAEAEHPPFSAIAETASHYEDWVLGLRGLIAAGRLPNDASTGAQLLSLQRTLERNGSRWDAADTAAHAAELALARGASTIARLHVADIGRLRGLLRRPARLDERVGRIESELAEFAGPALPEALDIVAVEGLLRGDGEGLPAEQALEIVVAARGRLSDDVMLAVHEARILRRLDRPEIARMRLDALLQRLGGKVAVDAVVAELAASALDDRDFASFDELLARVGVGSAKRTIPAGLVAHLRKLHAESLSMRGDPQGAERAYRALLADGSDPWVWTRLADIARARADWAGALEALDHVCAELEPGEHDWQRMLAASVLGRWAIVRETMERLGLPSIDEGGSPHAEIDADLGIVRCEFVEADGTRQRYWTRRTSPCTGVVVELAFPQDPQHFRDRVAYEPSDLDIDEDGDHPLCFRVAAVVEEGGWTSFILRGWDPGEAAIDQLVEQFDTSGFAAERFTAPGRTGTDPRDPDSEIPTLALLIAAPDPGVPTLEHLRRCLRSATAQWQLPLLCPELDAAIGDEVARLAATDLLDKMRP